MLRDEFNVQVARLEYWFEKKYTEAQKDHIWDKIKNLNNLQFSRVVDWAQKGRSLPKPHTLLHECLRVETEANVYNEAKEYIEKIRCERCEDFGYLFGRETQTGFEPVLMRCECGQATWYKAMDLPVANTNLTSGITPIKFQMSFFRPTPLRTQTLITDEWKEMLNTSVQFWTQRKGEK